MACFAFCNNDWDLKITGTKLVEKIVYYEISVRFGQVIWKVHRRYSEFLGLSRKLSQDHGISNEFFPPKKFKLFVTQSEAFIRERTKSLENFIVTVFSLLKAAMPRSLVLFLKIDCYDIFYVLESLSLLLTEDRLVKINSEITLPEPFSVLQVHALTRILKLPKPPLDIYGLRLDYSNILEFCSKLEHVEICGSGEYEQNSNLLQGDLEFDLSPFKSIKMLVLRNVNLKFLKDASDLRKKITFVTVTYCGITSMSEFILCDHIHKNSENFVERNKWKSLLAADFNFNCDLEDIDESVRLLGNLKKIDLHNNKIKLVSNLSLIDDLQCLNVSNNLISDVSYFSSCFKNLVHLDLSENMIIKLKGLEMMQKLTGLNLAFNQIDDLKELWHLTKLPLLDCIMLIGNPLSRIVDYRIKVLTEFGDAHRRIKLDNEESTQKELDTVAVLQALKIAKERRVQFS